MRFGRRIKNSPSYIGVPSWKKCLYLFTDPERAFDEISTEPTVFSSFWLFFIVFLLVHITTIIIQTGAYAASNFSELFPKVLTTGIVATFFLSLLLPFVITLVVHTFVILFGGKGIINTFKIITYSLIPFILLNMIPFIGHLFIILTLLMIGYGIHHVHGLAPWKAGLTIGIPFVVTYLAMNIIGWQITQTIGV